ncbi:RNA polymerase II subunit B1 CTD phosphatase RTR1 [Pichia kudriavzevii]|uniref:RNA polymerase II subunit B1 CTD phosphatase RPAP2 homolog n=1 Tax=Pichia kudriavzevii TaxID=4909 RepID=A0A1V2LGT5_PICKU|nr:RNA polymerase II subunit B1 CTD phosphatase RTR1 [Pichia kudriavzevii]
MTTVTVDDFKRLIHPLETHPLLTPKEANNLTYQIIELLMDKPCTSQLLQLLARYLTPQAYDALVEERIINHHCGYPLCPYSSSSIHDGEVNTVAKRLNMRAYYKTRYCSKRHYQCSEVFKRQLNSDALFMRMFESTIQDICVWTYLTFGKFIFEKLQIGYTMSMHFIE